MFDFYSLFELSQINAIHSAISPSLESIFRMKCREYSVKYSTPLHVVMNDLDPMIIMQALQEEQFPPSIVDEELDELLEKLYKIKDPNYSRMSAEETEALVDAVLNREIARAAKKKRPTQETIQAEIKEAQSKPLPKSGSMDFGQLEKIDSQTEANRGGFKD